MIELSEAWLLRLIGANTKSDVWAAVTACLAKIFEVESAQLLSHNSAFRPWIDIPLCGFAKELASASVGLFTTQITIDPNWQSMVVIGLPLGKSIGGRAITRCTLNKTRFTADMGVFYLRQIAELAASDLDRIQAYKNLVD